MITSKKYVFSSVMSVAALYALLHTGPSGQIHEQGHRGLQLKEFCANVITPFLESITGKYFPEFEGLTEEQLIELGVLEEDLTCESSASLELEFSLASNTTEDSGIDPRQFQKELVDFVDCRALSGAFGDIQLEEDSVRIDVTQKGSSLLMTCKDCFDNAICADITNNYNDNSTCFLDDSNARFTSSCSSLKSFDYELSSSGSSPFTSNDHTIFLEEYAKCSLGYFDLNKTIEELDLRLCVTINEAENLLEVVCSSVCVASGEYDPCTDMQETFLNRNLCFPPQLENAFVFSDDLFASCEAGAGNQYVYEDNTIFLPVAYVEDSGNVISEVDDFFQCRKGMGAYPDNFSTDDFPKVSFQEQVGEEYKIKCEDKCTNGAFCKDLKNQYDTELQCVKRYECNKEKETFDDVDIPKRQELWWNYKLNFLDGTDFQSYSLSYAKEVQERSLQNVKDYMQCRFESSSEYNENDFLTSGHLFMDDYVAYCWSACGTLPYCDALKIQRDQDPRSDHCYNRIIEACVDCRVETTYRYSLDFDPPQQGTQGTFEYNIQSLSNNPVSRQYYGSSGNGNGNFGSSANDKEDLQGLLDKYGLPYRSWKLNNLCSDLDEYVGCSDGTITELNLEIPRLNEGNSENGFSSNFIKGGFENLKTLIVGIDRENTIGFPTKFFNIPSLITLTIRGRGKLTNNLPASIGNMVDMYNLDLNQCENGGSNQGLTGNIPAEIVSVRRLRLIDLGCNQLSGVIPDGFYRNSNGNSKSYRVINLNDNKFNGMISNSINNMRGLEQLSLARNSFTGSLPNMKFLKYLRVLDVQRNIFGGKLHNIDILKKSYSRLQVVALNDNTIKGSIPTQIGRLKMLKYLNLKNNRITGDIPSELALCTNLKVLLLGNNPMDYNVPVELSNFLNEHNVVHDLAISPSRRLLAPPAVRRLDDSSSESDTCDIIRERDSNTVLEKSLDELFVVSKIEIRHQDGFDSDINVRLSIYNLEDETFRYDGTLSPFQSEKYEIFIGNKLGEKVEIELDGINTVLQNAKVEVFGSAASLVSFHSAVQSSDYWDGGEAELAIDGNQNGDWHLGSVSSTAGGRVDEPDDDPWWKGTLNHISAISKIVIYNRSDCCSERIMGFRLTISIGDEDVFMYDDKSVSAQNAYEIHVDSLVGNKIKIEILGPSKVLNLAEVEVFGFELPSSPFQSAIQSSTMAEANQAFDKNIDCDYRAVIKCHSQTFPEWDPWWIGTLTQVSTISMVTIYNMETRKNRLQGFHLTILNDDVVTFIYEDSAVEPLGRYDIYVPFRVGNTVKIHLKGNKRVLSLAEVEVFGSGGFLPTFQSKMFPNWVHVGNDINGEFPDDGSSGVALSNDGRTVAIVGGGHDTLNNVIDVGHVRVFRLDMGNKWVQLGSDIEGLEEGDGVDSKVDISGDGQTVAIGYGNHGKGGLVRVFRFDGMRWMQVGSDQEDDFDTGGGANGSSQFGQTVALSHDGNIIAVSAHFHNGGGTERGCVIILHYNQTSWNQIGSSIDGEEDNDRSGYSMDLSPDGKVVAIGDPLSDVNGKSSGKIRVYRFDGKEWIKTGSSINGVAAGDNFGVHVSISSDGLTLSAGGDMHDASDGKGGTINKAGYVSVFRWNGNSWSQLGATIYGESEDSGTGWTSPLSDDGNTLAVGSFRYDSNGVVDRGRVRIFRLDENAWVLIGSEIIGGAAEDKLGFAYSVSLSGDGRMVAIGAPGSRNGAGRVRIYQYIANMAQLGPNISPIPFDTASQSSTFGGLVSSNAFDESFSSISKTNSESNPWWEGTLQEFETISKVTIYNRKDCCQDELIGFRLLIFMDGNITFQYDDVSGIFQEEYDMNIPFVEGNKVRIELNGDSRILALAEVEIYGPPKIEPTVQPTSIPSIQPSLLPSLQPSLIPSSLPSAHPSSKPTLTPTLSFAPSAFPIVQIPDTPFYYYPSAETWDECKRLGEKYGHSFASIRNAVESSAVSGALEGQHVWLGGYQTSKDDEPGGNWAWLDGTPWDYTNWDNREPSNSNNIEDNVEMWQSSGKWNDQKGTSRRKCLFRDPNTTLYRDPTIIKIPNTPFFFHHTSKSWHDCKSSAEANGLTFASIRSHTENEAVTAYKRETIWVGGYQTSTANEYEGDWEWVDGTPWNTYINWASSQPNGYGIDYLYMFSTSSTWWDLSSSTSKRACLYRDNKVQSIPNTLFYFYNASSTWDECKIAAQSNGLSFAYILNNDENELVSNYVTESVWLGGYQTSTEGEPDDNWAWTDENPWSISTFTNWDNGEPNDEGGEEDHLLMLQGGLWKDAEKSQTHECIFRDANVHQIPNTAFYFYDTAMTFDQCKVIAENHGYLFASIRSQSENDVVKNYLNNINESVWLGGYQTNKEDEPFGNWAWVDGTLWAYTNWNTGEPNDWGDGEEHVQMYSNGLWNDGGAASKRNCLFRDDTD